ncbi:MAG: DUF6036 family nucleotidyltransferase [Solirubrobacteraceae bacterium]
MRRHELEHVIRAAADVAEDSAIVVIGSQAILGEFPNAPAALLFSQEADVYPRNRPENAIKIDGALGDGSRFHETFGYYAHGVGPETAKAPTGWEARLVAVHVAPLPGAGVQATGWCLDAHDVVLSKCAAGRERDWEFAEEAIRHGLVQSQELLCRIDGLPLPDDHRERVAETVAEVAARG